jgi:hypothetical protein
MSGRKARQIRRMAIAAGLNRPQYRALKRGHTRRGRYGRG